MLIRTLACLAVCLCFLPNVFAQRELKNIPVPDPELEKATFKVPDGFEVNLFPADPMIADGRRLLYGCKQNGIRQLCVMQLSDRTETTITSMTTGHAAIWAQWQPIVIQKSYPIP